jgi:hypothetical protein
MLLADGISVLISERSKETCLDKSMLRKTLVLQTQEPDDWKDLAHDDQHGIFAAILL